MNFIMVSRNLAFILQSDGMKISISGLNCAKILRKQKQEKPYPESTIKTAPRG